MDGCSTKKFFELKEADWQANKPFYEASMKCAETAQSHHRRWHCAVLYSLVVLIILASCRLESAQLCQDCAPDELSSVVDGQVPSSYDVTVSKPGCPEIVRNQVRQVAFTILNRTHLGINDYAELSRQLVLGASQQIQALAPPRPNSASCRNYFVVLPPGSEVTRVVLTARDASGAVGVCADDRAPVRNHPLWRDCGIGWSGFEGPVIQQLGNAVLVYGTLLNWSSSKTRQGTVQVNYKPLKGYLPKSNAALPVEVLYATSRKQASIGYFGPARGNALSFGKCVVTIPPNHRKGDLESPSWWRLEFSANPDRDVVLQSAEAMSETAFYTTIKTTAKNNPALVFVHGYNTPFTDAVRRTAQVKYDLGFEGPAISFSWPSQGSPAAYMIDETNAEWTIPLFTSFLKSLSTELGKTKVILVAHSMGTRVLMNSLVRLSSSGEMPPSFSKIVLAAPDIDRDVFIDMAGQLKHGTEHLTLYASSRDNALLASKTVHGNPRAGDTAVGITIADGVDTIDVSNVDTSLLGHSYYGDNRSIISDLYYLIRGTPLPRFGLKRLSFNNHLYWLFQP